MRDTRTVSTLYNAKCGASIYVHKYLRIHVNVNKHQVLTRKKGEFSKALRAAV